MGYPGCICTSVGPHLCDALRIALLLQRTALQSNGYDCGLWVLAWIIEILRGHDPALSDIKEGTMKRWRLVLGDLVQRHSVSS